MQCTGHQPLGSVLSGSTLLTLFVFVAKKFSVIHNQIVDALFVFLVNIILHTSVDNFLNYVSWLLLLKKNESYVN